jgi:hypothetical protein
MSHMRELSCYVALSCFVLLSVNRLHGLLVEYHNSYIRVAWKSYHFVINNSNHSVPLTLFSQIANCKLRTFCHTGRSASAASRLYCLPRLDLLSKLIVVLLCPSKQIGGTANMLQAGRSGFRTPVGARNVFFSETYRPALGPTQLPI